MARIDEWLENDKLILIEGWARDGLTEEQIAKNMGISLKTLYNWKTSKLPILQALKKGKEVVDFEVENALLKKSLGYNALVKKAFKIKDITYENGRKVKETERIEYAEEEIHIPADTTAQIFWLKNRQIKKWRDKVEFASDDAIKKLDELLEAQKNA